MTKYSFYCEGGEICKRWFVPYCKSLNKDIAPSVIDNDILFSMPNCAFAITDEDDYILYINDVKNVPADFINFAEVRPDIVVGCIVEFMNIRYRVVRRTSLMLYIAREYLVGSSLNGSTSTSIQDSIVICAKPSAVKLIDTSLIISPEENKDEHIIAAETVAKEEHNIPKIEDWRSGSAILDEIYADAKSRYRDRALMVLHDNIGTYQIQNYENDVYTIIGPNNSICYLCSYSGVNETMLLHEQDDNSSHKYRPIEEIGTVLDFGCTCGMFDALYVNHYCDVIGVDSDEKNEQYFLKTLEKNGFQGKKMFIHAKSDKDFKLEDTFDDTPIVGVKMDIDGDEFETLWAIKDLLIKYKPMLQICTYHKANDFNIILDFLVNVCGYSNFSTNKGFVEFEITGPTEEPLRHGLLFAYK